MSNVRVIKFFRRVDPFVILFALAMATACVAYDDGGPPGPAYGYDYGGPAPYYPWDVGAQVDIVNGYGHGGGYRGGWHGGGFRGGGGARGGGGRDGGGRR